MNTQDTSSRISPKPATAQPSGEQFTVAKRPHILVRREARRARRER